MNKSEAKFHNTALKMHRALFRLLGKKGLQEISIVELCAEAGVNRSTFYAHYTNTYDLLREAYNDRFEEFFASYDQTIDDIQDYDAAESIFISPQYLLPYLNFVRDNRRFFQVYMGNLQNFDADHTYSYLMEKVFLPACRKNGIEDRTTVNYVAKFYLQGITAIVLEWVKRDCAEDEHFVCKIITMCVRPYQK